MPYRLLLGAVKLKKYLNYIAEHVIVVYTLRNWKQYMSSQQYIAVLVDNCRSFRYILCEDIKDQSNIETSERIFNLFLQMDNSNLALVIYCKLRTERNYICQQAAQTKLHLRGRHIRCRLAMLTASVSSIVTPTVKRRKRSSDNKTKISKSSRSTKHKVRDNMLY